VRTNTSPACISIESSGTGSSETTQTSATEPPRLIETAEGSWLVAASRANPPGIKLPAVAGPRHETRESASVSGSSLPFSQAGVVDSETSSWPTRLRPSCSSQEPSTPPSVRTYLRLQDSARFELQWQMCRIGGADQHFAGIGAGHGHARLAPPHHQVAMFGIASGLPCSTSERRGRKARMARLSRTPAPRALIMVTEPAIGQLRANRGSQPRGCVKFERVRPDRIKPAPQNADRLMARDGAHHQSAVSNRQVLALEKHEAEIAGDIGMLEIGIVHRPRREDADAALPRSRRSAAFSPVAETHGRSRPAAPHWSGRTCLKRCAHRCNAVFQREAGSGRRLRAVAQNPPVRRPGPRPRSKARKCR
jgi:hypothetical protein